MRCSSAPRVILFVRGYPNRASGVLRASVLVRDANSQLLTALLAPTGKRGTPPLRFHTRTKSVRLEPTRIARAVSWLSH